MALMLLRRAILPLAPAGALPSAFRLGLGAVSPRRCVLLRPGRAVGVWPVLAIAILLLAAAVPVLAAPPCSLIALTVLLLRLAGVCALARLALAVLVGPRSPLAACSLAIRAAMLLLPPVALSVGPFKPGFRPAEAPDFLKFGFGCLAFCSGGGFDGFGG
jgi:hypothetical protein